MSLRPTRLIAALLLANSLRAASGVGSFVTALYQPLAAEQAALAPDGRHVAYTQHARGELSVIIVSLEEPYPRVRLAVADDTDLPFSNEKKTATLRFLRWAGPNRLVLSPAEEIERGLSGPRYVSRIMAVDADGKNVRTLLEDRDVVGQIDTDGQRSERSRPIRIVGFPLGDRDHLLVQAVGREIPVFRAAGAGAPGRLPVPAILPSTLYRVNLERGNPKPLGDEFLVADLGYDWEGHMRLSYSHPTFALARSFGVHGVPGAKLDESWLGPLAGKFTLSPENYFAERAYPLGFDADPAVLYVASNVDRDTFAVYGLNLKTRQPPAIVAAWKDLDLAGLNPEFPSSVLVFDEVRRQLVGVRAPGPPALTLWRDPQLRELQQTFDQRFPRHTVEILEWSDSRAAVLVRVTGGDEPGRVFVYHPASDRILEIARRMPQATAAQLHPTERFAFDTAAGVHLTGYLTHPRSPRLTPPAAVVCFASGLPAVAHPEFDREAQAFATMGLLVIRVNHRGVGGFGRKHRDAQLAAFDEIPAEDAVAVLDWIASRHPYDRRRVATFGNGFGGYLAVRAVQMNPERFRCAVAFNAPLDPEAWVRKEVTVDLGVAPRFNDEVLGTFLARGAANPRKLSAIAAAAPTGQPVFLVVDRARDEKITTANQRFRATSQRQGVEVQLLEVGADFAAGLPGARARAFERIEEFFNASLYSYGVKVGDPREVK